MDNEFDKIRKRRKLMEVNAGKRKVMVFERKEFDKMDFEKDV